MNLTSCRSRRSACRNSDLGCTAAKVTSIVLLSSLAISAAVAMIVVRRRPELPEPADAPPRVDDPLR